MARKKVKQIIKSVLTVLTPPPYVAGQSIKIQLKRGYLSPVPMMAHVLSITDLDMSIIFGGGKQEKVSLREDGVALNTELTK